MARRRFPLLFVLAFAGAMLRPAPAAPPPTPEQLQWVNDKLEKIVFPRLEFREVGVVEAVEFLRKQAVQLDPLRAGVPIYLHLQSATPRKPATPEPAIPGLKPAPPLPPPTAGRITVSLTNIPLSEALRCVTSLAGLKCRVLAIYIPRSRKLIARNTRDKLNELRAKVDQMWKEYYEAHPPQTAPAASPTAPTSENPVAPESPSASPR